MFMFAKCLTNCNAKKEKKRLWHRCFPANFDKFFRTAFFIGHLR